VLPSAALLTAALVALAFVHFRETPPLAEVMRFQIPPPEKSSFSGTPYLSPDGRSIAFTAPNAYGRNMIWIRALDSLEARALPGTDDPSIDLLFWSPDSRFVGFAAGNKLKKIEASGGPAQPLCDMPGPFRGGAWSREGVIIFGTTAGVFRVPQAGGQALKITQLDASRQESTNQDPVFLPDQRHFLYFRGTAGAPTENSGIYLGSLDFKPEQHTDKRLIAMGGGPKYAPSKDPKTGYMLFLRDRTLMAQVFDMNKLELTGEAVPIADDVGT
jgi:hypothetical protein